MTVFYGLTFTLTYLVTGISAKMIKFINKMECLYASNVTGCVIPTPEHNADAAGGGLQDKMVGAIRTLHKVQSGWGCEAVFPIIPDDVPMGVVAIYGFSPPLHFGRDHRLGFGFRFGNFADLQLMYEFGPQLRTKPLQPIKVRSAPYRSGATRRRPLVELLLRAGLLVDGVVDESLDQPR